MRALVFLLLAFTMGWMVALGTGCGSKMPAEPFGGAVNTGGKPDVDKSHGAINAGGEPNTGGAPDVNKSHGNINAGGPVNTGGKPDVKKSLPPGSASSSK